MAFTDAFEPSKSKKKASPTKKLDSITKYIEEHLLLMPVNTLPDVIYGWKKVVRRGSPVSYKNGQERVNLKKVLKNMEKRLDINKNTQEAKIS